jgi:hypothetical protein
MSTLQNFVRTLAQAFGISVAKEKTQSALPPLSPPAEPSPHAGPQNAFQGAPGKPPSARG